MYSPNEVATKLLENREFIFHNLQELDVQKYMFLQDNLYSGDVSTDLEYQSIFADLYSMSGHKCHDADWCHGFFSLLEKFKYSYNGFPLVLRELTHRVRRTEVAYASIMVATINPEKPLLTSYVLNSLDLTIPNSNAGTSQRGLPANLYLQVKNLLNSVLKEQKVIDLLNEFDILYPMALHIDDMKKLDFMLWQNR